MLQEPTCFRDAFLGWKTLSEKMVDAHARSFHFRSFPNAKDAAVSIADLVLAYLDAVVHAGLHAIEGLLELLVREVPHVRL